MDVKQLKSCVGRLARRLEYKVALDGGPVVDEVVFEFRQVVKELHDLADGNPTCTFCGRAARLLRSTCSEECAGLFEAQMSGYRAGLEDGRTQGHNQGLIEGDRVGYERGFKQGRNAGLNLAADGNAARQQDQNRLSCPSRHPAKDKSP